MFNPHPDHPGVLFLRCRGCGAMWDMRADYLCPRCRSSDTYEPSAEEVAQVIAAQPPSSANAKADSRPTASLGLLAFAAGAVLVGLFTLFGGGGGDVGAERTVRSETPVCGFDYSDYGNCTNDVKCRASDGEQEIYLPVGSAESGTEGWEWTKDQSGRCDPSEAPPEPAPMSAVERRCLNEASAAIDQAQATGVDENSLISQECLDLGF